ncbi:MAG: transglycosylase [Synechococcus sp.]|nr:transglycosylase [Synechococcus sp.]
MATPLLDGALLPLFAPYCGGLSRQALLEEGLRQLARGEFQGRRPLRGGGSHAFQLRWEAEPAPLEPARCTLTFPSLNGPDGQPITYSFNIPTHQLVSLLMAAEQEVLPASFWRWLLIGQSTPSGSS